MSQTSSAPIIDVEGVDFSYGRLQVLFDVSLQVEEGEALALLGTNGAGKSTLLRAISGLVPVQRGAIFFDGYDITRVGLSLRKGLLRDALDFRTPFR